MKIKQLKEQQEELQLVMKQLEVLEKYATKITEKERFAFFFIDSDDIVKILDELETITNDNEKNKRVFLMLSIFDHTNKILLLSEEITQHSSIRDWVNTLYTEYNLSGDKCYFTFLKELFTFREKY